jgi:ABC-2 type transport system ATP-binding protein
MSFFEAVSIDKYFGSFKALNNVSIHVPEGSIYGLLGPNGAGKTTLIRIINRITGPDKGEVRFQGKILTRQDLIHLGYLPEERGLYRKMKVGEQALYLAQLKGLSKKEAMKKLKQWFEKFEMISWWNKKIEELSKGMAQKVQFIVTVLHEPELLIFDEPFSGFDPVNATMLKKEVVELKEKGTTIIFSTHDMASVEELCDHITLIDKSKSILEGRVNDIKDHYKSNIFDIQFEGNAELLKNSLSEKYRIISSDRSADNKHHLRLQLEEDQNSNDVLQKAMKHTTICSFSEVLPSMNEIFIKAVSKNSKSNSSNYE